MSPRELLLQGQKPRKSWEGPAKVKTRPLSWKLHPLGSVARELTGEEQKVIFIFLFSFLFLPHPHLPAMYPCSHVCGYSVGECAHVSMCIQMPDITPWCHSSEVIHLGF